MNTPSVKCRRCFVRFDKIVAMKRFSIGYIDNKGNRPTKSLGWVCINCGYVLFDLDVAASFEKVSRKTTKRNQWAEVPQRVIPS